MRQLASTFDGFFLTIMPSVLATQLKRQLVFLRNSAAAYDDGALEEAVRIAVVIRVLCHDTAKSTSLLAHMGLKESIRLVSTAKPIAGDLSLTVDFGELMAGMTFGKTLSYDELREDLPRIVCPDWWTQTVFIRNGKQYSRRDIVLATVNKDGGAHVDAPDTDLKAFQESFWFMTETNADGTTVTTPLENNHFRMLRRFAAELLESHELIEAVNN